MRNRITDQLRRAPLLSAALVLYLALSAAEAARLVVVSDPIDAHDTGFSPWETIPFDDGAQLLLRWSEPRSTLRRPIDGAVMGLTLYRPADAPGIVNVDFELDGMPLDTYPVGAGVYTFYYYLPPMLPAGAWQEAQQRLHDREARRRAAAGDWWAGWQELHPWRRPPQPPAIEIALSTAHGERPEQEGDAAAAATPVDADAPAPGAESRTGSVALATVTWLDELPRRGTGLHAPDTDADGVRVRWTRLWASRPLEPRGDEGRVRLRALHPDIASQPVTVTLFWNDQRAGGARLTDTAWRWVAFAAPGAGPGVLTIHVDRTWSPARAGVSADGRELGVMMRGVRWR